MTLLDSDLLELLRSNGDQKPNAIMPDVYRAKMQFLTRRRKEILEYLRINFWEYLEKSTSEILQMKKVNRIHGIDFLAHIRQNIEDTNDMNLLFQYLTYLHSIENSIHTYGEILINNVEYEEVSYE